MSKELQYKRKILKQLYFANTISCTELSDMIGKSIPLTNKFLMSLVDDGFVDETGFAPQQVAGVQLCTRLKKMQCTLLR